jgi:hypothetical protein
MEEEKRSVRPWDMWNDDVPRATDEVRDERLSICMSCEHLVKFTKQCKKCGCFMAIKTKLGPAECPVGKWKAV